ncbi:MAG: hypothetical protein EOP59_13995, partial [Sphingomonadales bacterium]
YLPPLGSGAIGVACVVIGHLLFRTAYAAVNVPYLAMSARISVHSNDRAFVAGMRMLFGTMAWVIVARGTVPIGAWLSGSAVAADTYLGAAIFFALTATAILLVVGFTYREEVVPSPTPVPSIAESLRSLLGNRAFVTLNLAMMAMIVAVTVLNKSVLYYFRYFLGDDAAGQSALAWMGLVSGLAVPVWMAVQRGIGTRSLWFLAAGLCIAGLSLFALIGIATTTTMQIFLVAMQAAIVGLHFVFWAMLPNTIEYGERATGLRLEGAVFGLASLLQRVAMAMATRWTIALVPLGFFALSCLLMLLNPLGRGAHARIVRDLQRPEA